MDNLSLLQELDQLKKEVFELKDKNKIITQKFQSCKKERDELKQENKEL